MKLKFILKPALNTRQPWQCEIVLEAGVGHGKMYFGENLFMSLVQLPVIQLPA